jgi:hypothetical protein
MAGVLALVLLAACSGSNDAASPVSTTAPAATTTTGPVTYTAHITREVEVGGLYRQGIAKIDGGWIFSFNDGLFVTDDDYKQTLGVGPAIPAEWKAKGFNHIGDIDVVGGVLYAPLEQPDYAKGHQAMLMYDPKTLKYERGLDVPQNQNSFVTVDPKTMIAYTMQNFGGKALLRYDVAHGWKRLSPIEMSMYVDKVQGADIADGAAWLSADDTRKGVYRVDLATGRTQYLGSMGHLKGEAEGIDATKLSTGRLHVLDADAKIFPMRVIDFAVAPSSD